MHSLVPLLLLPLDIEESHIAPRQTENDFVATGLEVDSTKGLSLPSELSDLGHPAGATRPDIQG